MLLSIEIESAHGDQRSVHLQLTNNKRRLKRGCKRKKESTKVLIDRVEYIFNTGTLNDYTHPKEVDPYWDIVYRQYEFIVYMELLYKNNIKRCNVVLSDDDIISIIHDLKRIQICKKELLNYLMNFMNIMYGSVIQRKFYGWKYYVEDFVSKFNEVAVVNLTKLRFDVDQTRCSVYFYQAFWLSGLSIINKISEDLKRNESDQVKNCNSNHNSDDDFDTLYDAYGSDVIDNFNTIEIDNIKLEEVVENGIIEDVEVLNINTLVEEKLEEVTEIVAVDRYLNMDSSQILEDVDFDVHCVLKKLLHQLGINYKSMHSFTDKKIAKLGKIIKKKITNGELVLGDADKKVLVMLFSSPLLN
jgi:hypothetical protein